MGHYGTRGSRGWGLSDHTVKSNPGIIFACTEVVRNRTPSEMAYARWGGPGGFVDRAQRRQQIPQSALSDSLLTPPRLTSQHALNTGASVTPSNSPALHTAELDRSHVTVICTSTRPGESTALKPQPASTSARPSAQAHPSTLMPRDDPPPPRPLRRT